MNAPRHPLLDTEWPDEMHRVPVDDLREHDVSAECWCRPHMERHVCAEHGLHLLFYHRALDGRDFYPDGRIPLQ